MGHNGAGKTTIVKILSTLLEPTSGRATVAGYDVVDDAAEVRQSIGVTGQDAALDMALTGRENLVLFGRLRGMKRKQAGGRADELIERFDLVDAADREVSTYSGGMRRRIDIAVSLIVPPKVLFLDEPTTGLDPRSRRDVWALVASLAAQDVTVLLTTQYLEEADVLSDSIVILDAGRVIASGTAEELKRRMGHSYCQVTPLHPEDLARVAAVLSDLRGSRGRHGREHGVGACAPRSGDARRGVPQTRPARRRADGHLLAQTFARRGVPASHRSHAHRMTAVAALTERQVRASVRNLDIVFAVLVPVLTFVGFTVGLRNVIDTGGSAIRSTSCPRWWCRRCCSVPSTPPTWPPPNGHRNSACDCGRSRSLRTRP